MRSFMRGLAILALLVPLLLMRGPAAAFPLGGCTLSLTSLAVDGATLDTATGGDGSATQQDPLLVDWDGTVSWTGTTGSQVITDHTWHVDVFGLPTPLRGGDPNEDGDTGGSDVVSVSANAPFRFTGLFHVSGEMAGEGGSCSGSGWLKLAGDPIGTIPFLAGLALAVVGLVLLAVGTRGRWLAGSVGGLLLGVGAAVLLISFATLPLGAATPVIVLAAGLLLGVLASWFGRMRSAPAA
ncbi:MAG: hypothetical protein ACRDHD_10720 [Candidatus Limnocylindria bacterium]